MPTSKPVLPAPLQDAATVFSEKILLSQRDFARFVETIENPPPPTKALRKMMADYNALKAAHPEANL